MNVIEQKEELIKNINEMKQGSIEQMLLIIKYGLGAYFKAKITFGSENRVTKDSINIIKEMFEILRVERKMLNYILKNINHLNIDSAENVVGMLDNINDRTIEYYYALIDDIEDAAETGQEFRGYRPRCGKSTIITDDRYLREAFGLGLSQDDLKEFLGYEDDFWQYLRNRIKLIDKSTDIIEKVGVKPITDNGIIVDIDILVPKIIDLNSAITTLDIYEKAHNLYKLLGSCIEDYKELNINPSKKEEVLELLTKKAKEKLKIKM